MNFGFYPVGDSKRFKDQRIEDTIIFALDDFFQKNLEDSSDHQIQIFQIYFFLFAMYNIQTLQQKI